MTWAELARRAWAVLRYRCESRWRRVSIVARRRWRVVMLHRKAKPSLAAIPDRYAAIANVWAPRTPIPRPIGGSLLDPRVRESGGWVDHAKNGVVFRDNLFVPVEQFYGYGAPVLHNDRTGQEAAALLVRLNAEKKAKADSYPH